jgi:hypothetical protein
MATVQQQTVNGVKTINLHGKNYVEVSERVNQVHEQKAEFDILISEPVAIADRWLWKSVIKINGHEYRGNAEVKMNAPKNTPDGTNPFECAETSAIGRALGFAGFGSVESIASRDEIERGKPFAGEPAEAPAQPARRPASAPAPRQQPAQQAPQAAAQTRKEPEIPSLDKIQEQAAKYVTGGWQALRAHVVKEHELGDIPDEEFSLEHRREMYRLVVARATRAQQQATPAPATT